MNVSRILLAILALAISAVFPGGAAGALVPPGNSAANQYTETFPTAGGNAEAKGKGRATPGDVLGSRNAKKLDSQGRQGREAAAVVAATAPAATVGSLEGGGGVASAGGSGAGSGSVASGTAPAGAGTTGAGSASGLSEAVVEDTSGSSGVGEVLGQATGSNSSGGTGLLLPLVVLASALWAVVYFLRRRRRTA